MQSANHPDNPPSAPHCTMPALSQSCSLRQSTVPSWHHPAVSLLLPPHHGRRAKEKGLEVQLTLCVTTMVDVALLTLSHAAAPWKSKSQSNAHFWAQWAPTVRSMSGLSIKYLRELRIVRSKWWIMNKSIALAEAHMIVFRLSLRPFEGFLAWIPNVRIKRKENLSLQDVYF